MSSADSCRWEPSHSRIPAILHGASGRAIRHLFHHHYAYQNQGKVDGGTTRWDGIDNYLCDALIDQWRAGLRFEWMRDETGTRVGGNPVRDNLNLGPFDGSFNSLSADFDYRPHPNVLIRPEVRADWFDGRRSPDNDGLNKNQVLAAINAALQFLRDA